MKLDITALGIPLEGVPDKPDYYVSPISVLVVMRGIDSEGDEVYGCYTTEGMSHIEAGGLAKYANVYTDKIMHDTLI
jgi:hypothetical protein